MVIACVLMSPKSYYVPPESSSVPPGSASGAGEDKLKDFEYYHWICIFVSLDPLIRNQVYYLPFVFLFVSDNVLDSSNHTLAHRKIDDLSEN